MSQVQQFYAGQNVFITGGTGFLGKVLIEKLLRSCRDIGLIYILIRPKKGKDVQERVDALLGDTVFDVLRNDYPEFSKKIVGVAGDTAQNQLGLSATDHARLVEEVGVIFHLAATVRFTDTLETAVAINVNSVKYVIDIARACKNFKVGIHVSTAFSHCVRKFIDEELYPPPMTHEDVNMLVEKFRRIEGSEDVMEYVSKPVTGEWPNTYSFTKAIAESVVAEYATDLPFAIFRPSIVTSSYKSPLPGWLASPIGIPGIFCAFGLGIIHVALLDLKVRLDIVPVDYVCNALITSAWKTAKTEKRNCKDVPVYNYVSGNENPITWRNFNDKATDARLTHPSDKAIYYPYGFTTTSKLLYSILHIFLHLLPALIIDFILRLKGKQPRIYKLVNQIYEAFNVLEYFTTQQWDFDNQNVQELWKQLGPEDKRTFPFSMQAVDWDEYFIGMVKGLRKYILNEPDGNEERAKRRHIYLYIIHLAVNLISASFVLWVIWRSLSGIL
ncbi:fatty acyl-CoA reductase wat-like isoform X1 [Neodiprion fabricii]|uniref:fatty acyl-CoA reductase wat-like isoform X1 n=1 Tax=Neodiprion fabricii TaxID=2872261 RepID=UPI001ED8D3F3|nr:fatty acyl-CoA reductase wat-like isoform X1 [Neodiprion fabricii]